MNENRNANMGELKVREKKSIEKSKAQCNNQGIMDSQKVKPTKRWMNQGPGTVSYSICPNFESMWLG